MGGGYTIDSLLARGQESSVAASPPPAPARRRRVTHQPPPRNAHSPSHGCAEGATIDANTRASRIAPAAMCGAVGYAAAPALGVGLHAALGGAGR